MACPTCNGTMELVSRDSFEKLFHCPRCGTLRSLPVTDERKDTVPKLVERCRDFLPALRNYPQRGVIFMAGIESVWREVGIEEIINAPEERSRPMARKQELEKIIADAREELNAITDREEAAHAATLVGKCFKYRNCYSCPEGQEDYWWLYGMVTGAEDGVPLMFAFETDKDGKLSVRPKDFAFDRAQRWAEIPKEEFVREWLKVQAWVNRQAF